MGGDNSSGLRNMAGLGVIDGSGQGSQTASNDRRGIRSSNR